MTPPPAADVLYMHMSREPMTIPQLAHATYGVPVYVVPTMTVEERRDRQNAIRRCQDAITDLRRQGKPICSGTRGVWISDDPQEVADQARRLRERAIHQMLTARALRRTAGRMGQVVQTELWEAA